MSLSNLGKVLYIFLNLIKVRTDLKFSTYLQEKKNRSHHSSFGVLALTLGALELTLLIRLSIVLSGRPLQHPSASEVM